MAETGNQRHQRLWATLFGLGYSMLIPWLKDFATKTITRPFLSSLYGVGASPIGFLARAAESLCPPLIPSGSRQNLVLSTHRGIEAPPCKAPL